MCVNCFSKKETCECLCLNLVADEEGEGESAYCNVCRHWVAI
jgi:hypothetical protein